MADKYVDNTAMQENIIKTKEYVDKKNTQVNSLPIPSIDNLHRVYQYVGTTENGYIHNYFYECVSDGESTPTYSWQQSNVQPSGGAGGGHTIEDSEGTDLTQRDTMQFGGGFNVTDDSENEKTVVEPNLMTAADMDDVVTPLPSVKFNNVRCEVVTPRWLRFDPSNHKGLVIKGGISIKLSSGGYKEFGGDTHIDLTSDVTEPGKDYFVYLNDNEEVHAYTSKQSNGTYIGRFHTLCVAAGTLTMIAPASPSSGLKANDKYLVKPYREEDDPDFYAFYNKNITAVSVGAKYDVVTCQHPLSGYAAGDILPESVFCLTFKPNTMFEDAMVYDKATDIAVDVYLQSGTGLNTRSAYNKTHTVNREPYNFMCDMLTVGKRLLRDNEFTSIALGSNEKTNISGSADATYVGGHKDTNNRRMISAIGVEEACGYIYQWLQEVSSPGTGTTDNWDSQTAMSDGQGAFGLEYWAPHVAHAGGAWTNGAQCGSRCRHFNPRRSLVSVYHGGRGSSQVVRHI